MNIIVLKVTDLKISRKLINSQLDSYNTLLNIIETAVTP